MGRIPPHVFITFDGCGLAPPVESEKRAVEELLTLIKQHEVVCDVPESAAEEMERHTRAKQIVGRRIVACDVFDVRSEQFHEVQEILFGTKTELSEGEINDVRILLNAKHYLCTYFVTFDKKHILSKRDEIRARLGFEVVTPSECLDRLREYLH
jgi:predicted nucleic acid-binding protein